MFNTPINFDEVLESSFGWELPNGKYLVIIDSISKYVWANPVDGGKAEKLDVTEDTAPETEDTFVELKMQVIDGAFEGKLYFENLHMWAENETRKNIAISNYKKICKAIGVDYHSAKFSQIINKPFYIRLKTSKCGKYVNIADVMKMTVNHVKPAIEIDDVMF